MPDLRLNRANRTDRVHTLSRSSTLHYSVYSIFLSQNTQARLACGSLCPPKLGLDCPITWDFVFLSSLLHWANTKHQSRSSLSPSHQVHKVLVFFTSWNGFKEWWVFIWLWQYFHSWPTPWYNNQLLLQTLLSGVLGTRPGPSNLAEENNNLALLYLYPSWTL